MVNVKSVDTKKARKVTQPSSSTQAKQATNFFADVKTEFKKITWTSKEELQVYTKIVVGATFLCGMGVYFIDLLIRGGLSMLEGLTRFIFG
ncbi:MAG: preprotein translocase subunit SecE [Chlamydiota bacterium]